MLQFFRKTNNNGEGCVLWWFWGYVRILGQQQENAAPSSSGVDNFFGKKARLLASFDDEGLYDVGEFKNNYVGGASSRMFVVWKKRAIATIVCKRFVSLNSIKDKNY